MLTCKLLDQAVANLNFGVRPEFTLQTLQALLFGHFLDNSFRPAELRDLGPVPTQAIWPRPPDPRNPNPEAKKLIRSDKFWQVITKWAKIQLSC